MLYAAPDPTGTRLHSNTVKNTKLFRDSAIGALRCDRLQHPVRTVVEASYRHPKADDPAVCQRHIAWDSFCPPPSPYESATVTCFSGAGSGLQ